MAQNNHRPLREYRFWQHLLWYEIDQLDGNRDYYREKLPPKTDIDVEIAVLKGQIAAFNEHSVNPHALADRLGVESNFKNYFRCQIEDVSLRIKFGISAALDEFVITGHVKTGSNAYTVAIEGAARPIFRRFGVGIVKRTLRVTGTVERNFATIDDASNAIDFVRNALAPAGNFELLSHEIFKNNPRKLIRKECG